MAEIEASITQLLLGFSHHPYLLFAGVILILFASSFGLPLPEEVVLVTSGIIAHLSLQEARQTGLSPTIDPWLLSGICFAAVFMSDLVVFTLGRVYGLSLLKRRPLNRLFTEASLARVMKWTQKYGALACCAFRFTPAIRFPGHFMCGALKISYQKFILTDGLAALLTVPTQVLLLAFYGDKILVYFKKFKVALITVLVLGFLIWLAFNLKKKYFSKNPLPEGENDSAA